MPAIKLSFKHSGHSGLRTSIPRSQHSKLSLHDPGRSLSDSSLSAAFPAHQRLSSRHPTHIKNARHLLSRPSPVAITPSFLQLSHGVDARRRKDHVNCAHEVVPALPIMRARLFNLLPGMRWVPHDLPSQDSAKQRQPKKSRNPFSSKSSSTESRHGTIRARKSTISLNSEPDPELDARTLAQGQSMFFAMLPLEIRKIVYEYVMGEETVHLTMGSKKRFGHFVCEDCGGEGMDAGECRCRVLVGGREGERLCGACVRMLVVCRRM